MSKIRDSLVILSILLLCLFLAIPLFIREALNGPVNASIECCLLKVDSVGVSYFPLVISLNKIVYNENPGNNPEIKSSIKQGVITLKEIHFDKFKAVLSLDIIEPDIIYFDTGAESADKGGDSPPLYLPLIIQSASVKNGAVHFSHKAVKGKQAIDFQSIRLEISNWSFRKEDKEMAKVQINSLLEGEAKTEIKGELQPFAVSETMNIDYYLENLDMTKVNKVLLHYVPVDITSGTLSVYGEINRNNGKDRGYTKVFLEDFDIIRTDQDFVGVKHFFIEFLSAFTNIVLQNGYTDNVAVRIPFEKSSGEIDVDKSEAFWKLYQKPI